MEIIYQPKALDDLKYWKKSGNKQVQRKILNLFQSMLGTPFEGIGKPDLLNIILLVCGHAASIVNTD